MKDTHVDRPAPGKIPVISPVLHCVAMPALVWLRTSFGYAMFRPRSIFFAFSFAVAVLDYIAWNEPDIWREYRAACIFSAGAVALYWLHFAVTFVREFGKKPDRMRDDYSGTSHAFRVLQSLGVSKRLAELSVHLCIEPATVLVVAAALRLAFNEQHLSAWLVIVASCMICKDGLNYWAETRRGNLRDDMNQDAEELDKELGGSQTKAEAPEPTRTGKQTMKRTVSPEEERELRFADILGIAAPYDLEEAEANFRERIQLTHPDTHGDSPETHEHSVDLNEAIEFFREKLAG